MFDDELDFADGFRSGDRVRLGCRLTGSNVGLNHILTDFNPNLWLALLIGGVPCILVFQGGRASVGAASPLPPFSPQCRGHPQRLGDRPNIVDTDDGRFGLCAAAGHRSCAP